ncbi:Multidrug export protein MepA [Roseivivax jejudonensis]|uniref:Multidrug export protein MepA n=1 Tax=Roseivivax jejudonensis TaxID=1529041 RepID=A0A1X6ZK82_9RHOB|nr:MATE family efflux transporter [Roseivivax jejudonensis]SLN53203.1 Multidrug export protein MepA [Roseivivax jejudonensis]
MAQTRDLTDGPVWRALWRVSAPMAIGIIGVLSVGIADSYFLARAGETELTAIGFIYPVIVAITSLSIGLGAGVSAVVSQRLGETADDRESAELALHAVVLAGALAISVAAVLALLAGPLFGALGAEGPVRDAVLAYMPWWCAGFPFLVAAQALNSVFRAGGHSEFAAIAMVGQSLINIALDPLLIFGLGPIPAMGIEGAGIATATARALAFVAVLGFGLWTARIDVSAQAFRDFPASVRRIVRVGLPAAFSNAINPAGMALVTAAVATVGEAAVGGFGAATRVQSLLFVPMLALSAGIGPVVGQAWGAGLRERAQETVRLTFLLCLGYGAVLAVVLWLTAEPIARVMTDGLDAVPFATDYLRWVSVSFFGYGILVTANAAMNAREKPFHSLALSLGRIALVYVPLAWLGVRLFDYPGILGAAAAANVAAAAAACLLCARVGLFRLPAAPTPATPAN